MIESKFRQANDGPGTGELAVLGGVPKFSEPLHVGRPSIGDAAAMRERLDEIFQRRWFTNDGPLVRQFEREIARYVDVKHCILMCNATIALEIAIRALELKGEVIIPSYTFVATAHALQWQQISPVFADINPRTHNIEPRSVRKLLTPKTSAIIGVHLWGRACDTDALAELAAENNLKLIYDAAHAFGCSRRGSMIGGFGDCEVFSFHATKFLNSFEGGAVVTNNDNLADKVRLMRNFGFIGYDNVVYIGTNGKMTEICAAMGLTSLEAVDHLISINRRNYDTYRKELSGLPSISIIEYDRQERNNYQYVVIEVDPDTALLSRDELILMLHAENVLARRYFWPGCHKMEPYRSLQPNTATSVPETERVAARVILLPSGQAVDARSVELICQILKLGFKNSAAVKDALRHRH